MNLDDILLPSDLELMGIDVNDVSTKRYDITFYPDDKVESLNDFYFLGKLTISAGTIGILSNHVVGVIFPLKSDPGNGYLVNNKFRDIHFRLIEAGLGTPSVLERLGING